MRLQLDCSVHIVHGKGLYGRTAEEQCLPTGGPGFSFSSCPGPPPPVIAFQARVAPRQQPL